MVTKKHRIPLNNYHVSNNVVEQFNDEYVAIDDGCTRLIANEIQLQLEQVSCQALDEIPVLARPVKNRRKLNFEYYRIVSFLFMYPHEILAYLRVSNRREILTEKTRMMRMNYSALSSDRLHRSVNHRCGDEETALPPSPKR